MQLVDHRDTRSGSTSPHWLWVEKRDQFELYQRIQGREVFRTAEGSSIGSFVVAPTGETIFVGLYGVFGKAKFRLAPSTRFAAAT